MTQFRKLAAVALTATMLAALSLPARAESEAKLDAATTEAVTAKLVAEGYEVRSVGMEDGMIEVYAMKDGKKFELYLDDKFNVVKGGADN